MNNGSKLPNSQSIYLNSLRSPNTLDTTNEYQESYPALDDLTKSDVIWSRTRRRSSSFCP